MFGVGGVRVVPGEAAPLDLRAEAGEALYDAERAGPDRVAVRDLELD